MAATVVLALLALLVIVFDAAVGCPVLGCRGALYANVAAALVTALLAIVYSRAPRA